MMIGALNPDLIRQVSPFRVQLDWKAYWAAFREAHGDNPVPYKGRLLFSDSWTYSSTDHAGPEWPPPDDEDELRKVQLAYWLIRRRVVVTERDWLRALLASWEQQQSMRSVSMRQRAVLVDGDTKERTTVKGVLDIDAMRSGRLEWLEQDARDCEARVRELQDA